MSSTDAIPAIKINNLCKIYKIYRRTTDLLFEALGGRRPPEFVALDNISFEVRPGETVGIIGRNGAGKSTLLRILAGTLDKTSGSVEINGRISAILELGTGFHPDYSGRDNIVYGGLCMGMTRKEIQERQTQIIAFSELEKFIDQPFRTYSTGMQARLAFATTVCTDPDILIVDEALGVGDIKFQSKCFARMQEFRRARKSILLVSHDLNAITSFCDRAILLENGKILDIGKPLAVTRRYYDLLYGANNESPSHNCLQEPPSPVEADNKSSPDANANKSSGVPGFAQITDFGILGRDGQLKKRLKSGDSYTIFIEARFIKEVVNPLFGILIRDEKGVALFGTDTNLAGLDLPLCMPGEVLRIELKVAMWLAGGHFLLSPGVGSVEGRTFTALLDAYEFEVEQPSQLHTYSIVNLGHAFMMQSKDDFNGQKYSLVEKKNTPRELL